MSKLWFWFYFKQNLNRQNSGKIMNNLENTKDLLLVHEKNKPFIKCENYDLIKIKIRHAHEHLN